MNDLSNRDGKETAHQSPDAGPAVAMLPDSLRIAVLIPCHNEAVAIAKVVSEFRTALPQATVYVYDNNSSDDTRGEAERAGASVRAEQRRGKGYVVKRMFADIEADVYLMVDGDDTYDPAAAPLMLAQLIGDGLDLVNAARIEDSEDSYRPGHRFGNWLLTGLVRLIFGDEFRDMMSGYKAFSRRFVKSFPVSSGGFEIETELTIHALGLKMPTGETAARYTERPPNSESKLNTISDGLRVIWTIVNMTKQERPMALFSAIATFLAAISVILAIPVFATFFETGLVPRFPTAILSTGLMLAAFLSLTCGLILDTVTRSRQEAKRMRYLEIPGIHATLEGD